MNVFAGRQGHGLHRPALATVAKTALHWRILAYTGIDWPKLAYADLHWPRRVYTGLHLPILV